LLDEEEEEEGEEEEGEEETNDVVCNNGQSWLKLREGMVPPPPLSTFNIPHKT
jgi:hypothetical protein